jgi:hypothetical protein
VSAFLSLHDGQRCRDAIEDALDVDVDHTVPFVDLQALEQRLRHQARIVDHDIEAAMRLHGMVDQALYLIVFADVRLHDGVVA